VTARAPAPRGRLWPDARQELVLRAALLAVPAAVDAWRRVEADHRRGALDPGSVRLLPLVWHNLEAQGVRVERLDADYRATRAANETRLAGLALALRELDAAGIRTIVLKGAALVAGGCVDVGARPMSDVDVLVPPAQAVEAGRALERSGWRPSAPLTVPMVALTHSLPYEHPTHASVDLHWHVFEECCGARDDDDLWAASTPLAIGGVPTRVPAPEDQLLNVCVHGEKWVRVPGIRWIADAMALLRCGAIGWERLVEQAGRRRFVARMVAQLDYLRAAFDAPIPPRVQTALAGAPVSRIERFEARWGVRDRRRPWWLVYWCNHVRIRPRSLPVAVVTFPRYLQAVWRLPSVRDVPRAGLGRVVRALRGR
jgi:hypothetical protein